MHTGKAGISLDLL